MGDARQVLLELSDRLPFGPGDVLVFPDGEEAWLAGASLIGEDAPVAVLFRAPSAGPDRAVYLRAVPPYESFWLTHERTERGPIEPPSSLEEGAAIYSRSRRLPVQIARIDDAAFDIEGVAILGEYRGVGDQRLLRVATAEAVMLFSGKRIGPGGFDRLPGK